MLVEGSHTFHPSTFIAQQSLSPTKSPWRAGRTHRHTPSGDECITAEEINNAFPDPDPDTEGTRCASAGANTPTVNMPRLHRLSPQAETEHTRPAKRRRSFVELDRDPISPRSPSATEAAHLHGGGGVVAGMSTHLEVDYESYDATSGSGRALLGASMAMPSVSGMTGSAMDECLGSGREAQLRQETSEGGEVEGSMLFSEQARGQGGIGDERHGAATDLAEAEAEVEDAAADVDMDHGSGAYFFVDSVDGRRRAGDGGGGEDTDAFFPLDEPAPTEPLEHVSTEDLDSPLPLAQVQAQARAQGRLRRRSVVQTRDSADGQTRASDYLPRAYAPAMPTGETPSASAEAETEAIAADEAEADVDADKTPRHASERPTPRATRDKMSQVLEPYPITLHDDADPELDMRDGEGYMEGDGEEEGYDEDEEAAREREEFTAMSYHSGDSHLYEMAHRPLLERTAVKRDIREFVHSLDALAVEKRYKVVDRLGEGTFSSVYLAKDLLHNRYNNKTWTGKPYTRNEDKVKRLRTDVPVALKKILATSSPKRIENELEILEALRNVSTLITAFREFDQVIIVLPYHQSDDFRHFYKHMDSHHIRLYMRHLLQALKDIHRRGIIHRDVKPANFLFDYESGKGVLCDFGLAERYSPPVKAYCQHRAATIHRPHGQRERNRDTATVEQAIYDARKRQKAGEGKLGVLIDDKRQAVRTNRAGTRGFRAPEVLFKCPDQTMAIDVWSAGVMLLSMLALKFPVFNSNDDIEALMELASMFGRNAIERAAALHNRTIICNVPGIDTAPPNLAELILEVNPHLYTPPLTNPTPEQAKEHIEAMDAAIDLCRGMLHLDATQRYSADWALRHEFLNGEGMDKEDMMTRPVWGPMDGKCGMLHGMDRLGRHHAYFERRLVAMPFGTGIPPSQTELCPEHLHFQQRTGENPLACCKLWEEGSETQSEDEDEVEITDEEEDDENVDEDVWSGERVDLDDTSVPTPAPVPARAGPSAPKPPTAAKSAAASHRSATHSKITELSRNPAAPRGTGSNTRLCAADIMQTTSAGVAEAHKKILEVQASASMTRQEKIRVVGAAAGSAVMLAAGTVLAAATEAHEYAAIARSGPVRPGNRLPGPKAIPAPAPAPGPPSAPNPRPVLPGSVPTQDPRDKVKEWMSANRILTNQETNRPGDGAQTNPAGAGASTAKVVVEEPRAAKKSKAEMRLAEARASLLTQPRKPSRAAPAMAGASGMAVLGAGAVAGANAVASGSGNGAKAERAPASALMRGPKSLPSPVKALRHEEEEHSAWVAAEYDQVDTQDPMEEEDEEDREEEHGDDEEEVHEDEEDENGDGDEDEDEEEETEEEEAARLAKNKRRKTWLVLGSALDMDMEDVLLMLMVDEDHRRKCRERGEPYEEEEEEEDSSKGFMAGLARWERARDAAWVRVEKRKREERVRSMAQAGRA